MNERRAQTAWLSLLFFFSGAAALGHQMVWVRMLTAGLGHEVPAVVAVTAAFLGGLAVGAWSLSRAIASSPRPGRWYGGLELGIGVWALLVALFMPLASDWALRWIGPVPSAAHQWLVVFAVPFATLLPATAAMGATLPAAERMQAPWSAGGRCLGAVYAANTFGAVLGVALSAFALMPHLGFRHTAMTLAAINVACGGAALALALRPQREPPAAQGVNVARAPEPSPRLGPRLLATGLLGIGFEWVGIRILSQVLENTFYTFAAALAAYLIWTAVGALLYQRLSARWSFRAALVWLLGGSAASCLFAGGCASWLHALYHGCRALLGDGLWAVALSELAAASLVFAVPTMVSGALFSHLVQAAARRADGVGRVGRAVAWNALGCALATGVIGLAALPLLGPKWSLAAIALGYPCLMPRLARQEWVIVASAAAIFVVLFLPATVSRLDLPPGATVLETREGALASVAVVATPDHQRSLRVNNRLQMGGTAVAVAERRQAHLPLLLHPGAKRALFLGPGTGITLGAAAVYPELKIDAVELVPEVLAVMRAFEPENAGVRSHPAVRLLTGDARRFVRTTADRYDVIVADLFHPGQDGAGFLYTHEHFEAIRHRLADGGLFCQWLPLHQLDESGIRSIVRTFLESFPEAQAFLLHFNVDIPVLGLMGAQSPLRLRADWLEGRLQDGAVREQLRGCGLDKPIQVLGCWVGNADALRHFAADVPVSTDDRPAILFRAPCYTTRRETHPEQVLLALLGALRSDAPRFAATILDDPNPAFGANLADFIAARDLYLRGLAEEGRGDLSTAIDRYLESTQRSLFFTPAYARCVTIIQVMAAADRARAHELFGRLEAAQPGQPLGRKLLAPLFEAAP